MPGVAAHVLSMAAVTAALTAAPQAARPAAAPGEARTPRPGQAYAGMGALGRSARPVNTTKVPEGHIGGMDVSSWQPGVDWAAATARGARFSIAKATEGIAYKNPYYAAQSRGAADAGMVHGAYHFALPNVSGGAAQADYFIANGGGWTSDGRTLPGALDVENNPYRNGLDICYGLSPAAMVAWIGAFTGRYEARTGRRPLIYTNYSWWRQCTKNDKRSAANPLWTARWRSPTPAPFPGGWKSAAVWQYDDAGLFAGDQDAFPGDGDALRAFAAGPET
ncbi:GH25 family lysozyme [Actinomadura napierensis]|uniref:Lysozyme n=1 Tax=Actinomadura napierensis TaxID=267854 RepID=A0ABN3AG75_9ACTN